MADRGGFVADGERRWWTSPEGVNVRERIEAVVRSRYRAEFRRANWYKRLWLGWRIQREIAAEVRKTVPAETLWAKD